MAEVIRYELDGHQVELLPRGPYKSGRIKWCVRIDGETDWAEFGDEWHARRVARDRIARAAAPTPPPKPEVAGAVRGRTGWSRYSRGSSQAGLNRQMTGLTGVESPAAARRECHFCGQPLNRRGSCDECV